MVLVAFAGLTKPIIKPCQIAVGRQHSRLHSEAVFEGQSGTLGLIQTRQDRSQLEMSGGIVMLQSDCTQSQFDRRFEFAEPH